MELKYYIFDWDDNILHMDTKINMEVLVNNNWLLTEVTTTDFTKFRSDKNYRLPQFNGKDNYDLAYINFRDVGKHGDDSYNGGSHQEAFLTFGAAITAAEEST